MSFYNSRTYRHGRELEKSRRISSSLLNSIGFEEHDGFEDILDNFRYVSGRRFHNTTTSKYSLPNDEMEIGRLELSHHLFKRAFGGNFSSPVKDKLKDGIAVLDVGCGTGSWIIENAKEYPKSTFIGIDMSPIFPTEDKPQNAGFIECNILNGGLPFPSNTFDFVHQRLLYAAFTERQWPQVIKEIIRVLKPSGYAEFMELDILNFYNSGPYTKEILGMAKQFYQSKDICLDVPDKLKGFMDSTRSLGEVNTEARLIPVGKRDDKFGELMLDYVRMSVESLSVIITRRFKYTRQEYLKLIEYLLKEVEEYKSSLSYTRFYAQKI